MAEPHPAVMTDGGGGKSNLVAAHLTKFSENSIGERPDDRQHAQVAQRVVGDVNSSSTATEQIAHHVDHCEQTRRFVLMASLQQRAHRPSEPLVVRCVL